MSDPPASSAPSSEEILSDSAAPPAALAIAKASESIVLDVAPMLAAPGVSPVVRYVASLPSENSRRAMRDAIKRLARATNYKPDDYENLPWWRVDAAEAGALRAWLLEHHSIATAKLSLAGLKGILEQCFLAGAIPGAQLERVRIVLRKKIRGERLKEPAGRMLSDEEIRQVRRACLARGPFAGALYDALVCLPLGTGLRRDEVARLTVGSVSDDVRWVRFVGKGAKEARQPIPAWAAGSIESWMAQRERFPFQHDGLFVRLHGRIADPAKPMTKWCVTTAFRDIARWSGVDFSAHDLRRTFGTTLTEAKDLAIAQRGMRHSDPKTTSGYDRRSSDQLAAAIEEATEKWGKL